MRRVYWRGATATWPVFNWPAALLDEGTRLPHGTRLCGLPSLVPLLRDRSDGRRHAHETTEQAAALPAVRIERGRLDQQEALQARAEVVVERAEARRVE